MSEQHPLEALLRPPVEFYSAFVGFMAAGIAVYAPWSLFMTRGVAWTVAGVLFFFAWTRFRAGYRVLRYQHNLKRLPIWSLRADQIPVSDRRLFLGKGFRWTQQHTQRLRDTIRPDVRKYVEMGPIYEWARRKEFEWEKKPGLAWVARLVGTRAWWNPVRPMPPVGGNPRLHGVEPDEVPIHSDLGERVGHTLVLGTTRVGKTRLAEVLIAQDIRRGDVTIVFDPKGDAELLKRCYAEAVRAGRADQFYMFHLGFPEISARYNAIGSFNRITEVATRISNQLSGEGNSAAFREFAWRFINIVARALHALGRRPDYHQIVRHINSIEGLLKDYYRQWLPTVAPDGWEGEIKRISEGINERNLPFALKGREHDVIAMVQYAKDNGLYDPVADGLRSAFEYDKTYFDKIVASLLPLMEKLTTGKIAELISPDYLDPNDPRPIFDWKSIIRRGGIVYVGLDALTDTSVAAAVGNSMFADLVSVAGDLYKHGSDQGLPGEHQTAKISLHADEFNELIGPEFIPLLNRPAALAPRSRPTRKPGRMSRPVSAIPPRPVRSPVTLIP